MTGKMSSRRFAAIVCLFKVLALAPARAMLAIRSTLPRWPPSIVPRAFATFKAALVLAEIIEASYSATAAII